MARSIFYREKLGSGLWLRATGTSPFALTGLVGGAVYQIDIGDGLPFLEFTPAETAVGNLITNGLFTVDANWTKGSGWTINAANGLAVHNPSSNSGNLDQALVGGALAAGLYRLTYTLTNYTGGQSRPILTGGSGANVVFADRSANGTYVETKTVTPAHTVMRLSARNSLGGSISNVILEGPL